MKAEARLDKAGRLTLPKALRDKLGLRPGDRLELTLEGGQVTLRPQRSAPAMAKERGIWVFRFGEPITAEDVRAMIRAGRHRRNSLASSPQLRHNTDIGNCKS